MTVDDGFGTEASLTVQDGDFADDGDIEDDDEHSSHSRRRASSGSNRRSVRGSAVYETARVSLLWSALLVLTTIVNLFAFQYVLPYLYYNDNLVDENTKVIVPRILQGSKEWALKSFGDENRFPAIDAVLRFELDDVGAGAPAPENNED